MKKLIASMLLLACNSLWAASVTYTLSDVVFRGGGTAGGTFVRDSLTGAISDVNLYTTADTDNAPNAFTGALYNSDEAIFSGGYLQFFTDNYPGINGETALVIYVGNSSKFLLSQFNVSVNEWLCTGDPCSASSDPLRVRAFCDQYGMCGLPPGEVGEVSGKISAVPIPAAVWLFGTGLGLLGWLRGRQVA